MYPLRFRLESQVHMLSISWGSGNNLFVTVLRNPEQSDDDREAGCEVVTLRLSCEIGNAQWRRIGYGSMSLFALLQGRGNSISSLFKMDMSPSRYQTEWWEDVMEYSKEITPLLSNSVSSPAPLIEDPILVIKLPSFDSWLA
ncbi:unnamed protein product [Eruca vesicaria subsp. sativa]|uniref:Uncharacterized protein n=1 Tax=Eruca vesicaria subsp. sativa TaxID=29727 RepID=A0ABC8K1X8_ERUVS|nr:unnamed protein product [Eruca vesicaria subsp. sativa]